MTQTKLQIKLNHLFIVHEKIGNKSIWFGQFGSVRMAAWSGPVRLKQKTRLGASLITSDLGLNP